MSNNTNTLFWIITGAVIVLVVFVLINTSQNNTLNRINNKFSEYFENISNNENNIDYSEYIPEGFNVVDIVNNNGLLYINGNVIQYEDNMFYWDERIINTNRYDVDFKDVSLKYYNSITNELIIEINLPFDQIMTSKEILYLGTASWFSIEEVNHYIKFDWGD